MPADDEVILDPAEPEVHTPERMRPAWRAATPRDLRLRPLARRPSIKREAAEGPVLLYGEGGLDAPVLAVFLVVGDLNDLGGLPVRQVDGLAYRHLGRGVGDGPDFAACGVDEAVAEADRHGRDCTPRLTYSRSS
jgi:hypothetical protein